MHSVKILKSVEKLSYSFDLKFNQPLKNILLLNSVSENQEKLEISKESKVAIILHNNVVVNAGYCNVESEDK